jgi:hypothetical protein
MLQEWGWLLFDRRKVVGSVDQGERSFQIPSDVNAYWNGVYEAGTCLIPLARVSLSPDPKSRR